MKKLFLFLVLTIPLVNVFAQSEAPSNLTATIISSKQINLAWKDNSNRELLFEIERSTTSETSGFTKLGEVTANVTSYNDGNPSANNFNYYRVRAKVTATTFSGYTNVVFVFPPVAPIISKIEVNGTNWIAITFKVQGGKENGFVIIQRRQGQTGAWSTIGTFDSNLTFYDDKAVPTDNTQYCYRVSWSGAPTEFSNISCATTLASPPIPPTGLSAVAVSSSQINLSWTDASNNESGFEIFRSTDNVNFTKIADVGANVTTYSNTGLNASTRYYYYVGSQRGGTPSRTKSNTADATTFVNAPFTPSNLTATAVSSTQINLTWTDNANNETGFELERSTDGVNFGKIADLGANTASYQNTGLNASTRYWYRIRSKNAGGNSNYSNVADATTQAPPVTIPRLPSGLAATAASSSQINLSWTDNANDETGFELESSTDGTNFTKITDLAANTTTYSHTGLNASTKYYYRIRAKNSAGPSPYSNVADATTQAPPIFIPRPPTALTATATSSSQINLSWADNASDETGFELERSTDGTNFTKITDLAANATTYSNTGLNASTRYYYRLRAKNSAGPSSYSNVADATTQAPPIVIPRPPSSLTATATSSTQINLSWTDNASDETGFELESSTDGTSFTKITDLAANATTYSNTGLNASTRYYYRLRAKNSAGPSSYSNVADATTQAPPIVIPRPPSSLTATATSSTQINLTWTDNASDETGFELESSTDGTNFTKITDLAANTTTYSHTGLNASTKYYYRIRAKNSAGPSLYSNVADATTQAPPVTIPQSPSALAASAASSSQINLTWADNAKDETGFEVERSTDGTNFVKIADVAANATTYSNTGLNSSTKYYYRIRAKNSAGNSTYSNVAEATTALGAPSTPTNLTGELADYDQARLTWPAQPGTVANVVIERSTSPTTGFTQITQQPGGTTTYVDLGLNEQTTYYYRIQSKNAAGVSGYSNVVSVTTPEVIIGIKPLPSDAGLTVFSIDKTLHVQNNGHQTTYFEWKLVSFQGRQLQSETTVVNSRQTLLYDFSGHPSGLYVVLIHTDNQVFSKKIMLY